MSVSRSRPTTTLTDPLADLYRLQRECKAELRRAAERRAADLASQEGARGTLTKGQRGLLSAVRDGKMTADKLRFEDVGACQVLKIFLGEAETQLREGRDPVCVSADEADAAFGYVVEWLGRHAPLATEPPSVEYGAELGEVEERPYGERVAQLARRLLASRDGIKLSESKAVVYPYADVGSDPLMVKLNELDEGALKGLFGEIQRKWPRVYNKIMKKSPGRPSKDAERSPKNDEKLYDDWHASCCRRIEDFASTRGLEPNKVRKAIDRHRKRPSG